MIYRGLEVLCRCLLAGIFDFRAEGVGNVPRTGGVILACMHQSHLDPVLVRTPLSRAIGFVAKKSLFRIPGFAAMIRGLGAVELDRDAASPAGLREVVDLLRRGAALVFFPEGTRSPDGELSPLRPGIALLASRSGAPVVPVALDGAYDVWPRRRRLFRPGRIRVVYGEPATYSPDLGRDEILADLDRRLRALRDRARRLA